MLVYEDYISQPDRNVENPDNSDLPKTQSTFMANIGLERPPARKNHATKIGISGAGSLDGYRLPLINVSTIRSPIGRP
jgi:hypothetical protein